MFSCGLAEVNKPPIGKEKQGQYPEIVWIDINVRFLGALLALSFLNRDNRILF